MKHIGGAPSEIFSRNLYEFWVHERLSTRMECLRKDRLLEWFGLRALPISHFWCNIAQCIKNFGNIASSLSLQGGEILKGCILKRFHDVMMDCSNTLPFLICYYLRKWSISSKCRKCSDRHIEIAFPLRILVNGIIEFATSCSVRGFYEEIIIPSNSLEIEDISHIRSPCPVFAGIFMIDDTRERLRWKISGFWE